jgi:hypothetical protein
MPLVDSDVADSDTGGSKLLSIPLRRVGIDLGIEPNARAV